MLYEEWRREGFTLEATRRTLETWRDTLPDEDEFAHIFPPEALEARREAKLRETWGTTPEAIEGQRLLMQHGRADG